MNRLVKNQNLKFAAAVGALLLSCVLSTNTFARGLYKSVGPDGKITYSTHPPADSQSAKNISSLKNSPKFSLSNKQYLGISKRS